MTLIVSPGFFWLLIAVVIFVICGLWFEVWALTRDYDRLEKNRDWWEQYANALSQRQAQGPVYRALPKEFDI